MNRIIVSGVVDEEDFLRSNRQENDDYEDDDSSDGGDFQNLGHMSKLMAESWRAIEAAALAIPDGEATAGSFRRAIGSRLGASGVDSIRGAKKQFLLSDEGTQLLPPKSPSRHKPPKGPPPLMKWIWIALLCAGSYALYNISIKKGSASINPIMGGVILQFVAALLGTLLLGSMIANGKASEIHYDKKGLLWSMGAGLWVGTAEMVSFVVSGMGVPATQFIPIIIGGSVMFGSILGVATLGEVVMLHGWSGVVMLCIGIVMVATDPGEKVDEEGGPPTDVGDEPPLSLWIGPALFCALAYALYNICIKKGSASINPIVGAVILQFVAAIYGSCILGIIYLDGVVPEFDGHGILWACWAGIFVGAAELLSFCVSGMGVQASQSIPIIIGGSVGFGAVLGLVMLGEELELQGWAGVLLLMIGVGFVATDPGEKLEGH